MHDSVETVLDKDGKPHEVVDFHNDYTGAKLGIWLFLFTELMLFGGMFLVFTFYFYRFTDEFVQGSDKLNLLLGSINTVILLVSTYFMGMTVAKIKQGNRSKALQNIFITAALATTFVIIKYFEWTGEIHHGIYPDSDIVNAMQNGETLFFGLYFTMTGLHGIHVIVGIGVMLWLAGKIKNGTQSEERYSTTENIGLYWDLVHLVWIFLFPLFYQIS